MAAAGQKPRAKSWRWWILRGAGVGSGLVLLAILFFPAWLCSDFGMDRLREEIFGDWDGDVEVGGFDVGWIRPLEIHNVRARFHGRTILEIETIRTRLSFFQMIAGDRHRIRQYSIHGLRAVIDQRDPASEPRVKDPTREAVAKNGSREPFRSMLERLIPVEPDSNCQIEIIGGNLVFTDQQEVILADIKNVKLSLRIQPVDGISRLDIQPAKLLNHGTMKIELKPHLPGFLQGLIPGRYVEATVSTRILEYSVPLGATGPKRTAMEIVIHDLRDVSEQARSILIPLIRRYSGADPQSSDIARIRILNNNGVESIEFESPQASAVNGDSQTSGDHRGTQNEQ